jgi:hypothetical protein
VAVSVAGKKEIKSKEEEKSKTGYVLCGLVCVCVYSRVNRTAADSRGIENEYTRELILCIQPLLPNISIFLAAREMHWLRQSISFWFVSKSNKPTSIF